MAPQRNIGDSYLMPLDIAHSFSSHLHHHLIFIYSNYIEFVFNIYFISTPYQLVAQQFHGIQQQDTRISSQEPLRAI